MSDRPPFAPIEALDAEPARAGRRARRWEALLGALLVLAVIGFAGGQWWDQQAKVTHYQAGSRAAAALDWARAAAEYGAAGAYRDAPQQAARAQATLVERETLYGQAEAAANGGDWSAVFDALPRLRQIGPDYRETPQLAVRAAAQAPQLGLGDTVARRAGPGLPGLYSYLPGGWRRLPGSDVHSRVRATCPDGDILYDGVLDGAARGANGSMIGRHIVRASRAGSRATTLALNALRFDRYECTGTGVWGLRYENTLPGPDSGGWTYQAGFQATGSPQVLAPALPDPTLAVIDVTPNGEALVLNSALDFAGDASQVQLFVAAPDGSPLRLLDQRAGQLGGTAVSPDGRYVLATVNQPVTPTRNLTQTVLLFDTRSGAPPRILAQQRVAGSDNANVFRFGVDAVFIADGPWRGRIVLNWPVGPRQAIRLIDPARPAAPLLDLQTAQRYGTLRLLAAAPAGGLVLATSRSWERQTAHNGGLVYVDAGGRLHETAVPVPSDFYFGSAWVRAGQIVYVLVGTGLAQGIATTGTVYTVSSLPLDPWPPPPARPTTLYTTSVPNAPAGWPAARWQAGPGLLAYVAEDGQVHARTYTTGADVPLDLAATGFSAADTRSAIVP